MKFKVGDKVGFKFKGSEMTGEIVDMIDAITNCPYIVRTADNDFVAMGPGLVKIEEIKEEVKKTNRIRRMSDSGNECVIEWDIDGNMIKFSVDGDPLDIQALVKILLHETEVYDYKYDRISPFKLERRVDTENRKHKFVMRFIDIKDDFKEVEKVLLETGDNMNIVGVYEMFIPDFLELCVERRVLDRKRSGYVIARDLERGMKYCTYIPCKPSVRELTQKGFIIPEKYNKL